MDKDVAKTHKYLKKRHQTYVLRVPVPKDIQDIIGKKEITRSLKTRDLQEANYQYCVVLGEIQSEFAVAQAKLDQCTSVHLNDFDPISTAKGWHDREKAKLIENDIQQFGIGEKDARIEDLRHELAVWKSGEFEQYASHVQMVADSILIETGYPRLEISAEATRRWSTLSNLANVDKSDMKYHRFVELIRKALVQMAETELEMLGVNTERTPIIAYKAIQNDIGMSKNKPSNARSINQLITEFLDLKEKRQDIRDKKTLTDLKSAFRFLTETVGTDFAVQDLNREHFLRIYDLVDKFPVNARKSNEARTMTVTELVAMGDRKKMKIISVTTKNKIMARLGALMEYAVDVGYINLNPCKRLRFGQTDAEKTKHEKRPFTEQQLIKLFRSEAFKPNYAGSKTLFWTTVLALFHGFRMEEILQLKSSDVKKDDKSGVYFFNLHDDGDNRLKNKNARRRVPVHPTVLELGFDDVLRAAQRSKNKRIFADVKRAQGVDTSFRKNFTRTYSRYLKKHGVYDPLTTFHSLRRNFTIAATNAQVPDNILNVICGWKLSGGQNGTYLKNRDFDLALLRTEIDKVSYPFIEAYFEGE